MNAVKRRVIKLEDKFGATKRRPLVRVTESQVGYLPNPEESTCARSLADGTLTGIIHWRVRCDQMTAENLDRFVEKFPIECSLAG